MAVLRIAITLTDENNEPYILSLTGEDAQSAGEAITSLLSDFYWQREPPLTINERKDHENT